MATPNTAKLKRAITANNITDFMWAMLEYGVKEMKEDGESQVSVQSMLKLVAELNANDRLQARLPEDESGDLDDWLEE